MAGDTQWPRFEVFVQDRPDRPHKNVGSVHAPDAEIALQNARDVFVRRPRTHNLWVVPAAQILACTREELAEFSEPEQQHDVGVQGSADEPFLVFEKQSQRRSMTFVEHTGEVTAASAGEALQQAVQRTVTAQETFVWWVCPKRAVTSSAAEDELSWFTPAESKTYKQPQEFRTVSMMHDIMVAADEEEGEGATK